MAPLRINAHLAIDEAELSESFILASGPGGQNVNKVATAVQLRFDAMHSKSLPPDLKSRLKKLAGKRMSKDGVIVLTARQHRSQDKNRADARARLVALIAKAAPAPIKRKPTKPTLASKKKRVETKKKRAQTKRLRGRTRSDD